MKIWYGYGSEHSMNLVMIGHFKTPENAQKVEELIDRLTVKLDSKIDIATCRDRFGAEIIEILEDAACHFLSPVELEQFLYEKQTSVEGDKVILKTQESDVSAFLKLMIANGARVEIYSSHDYPRSDKTEQRQ